MNTMLGRMHLRTRILSALLIPILVLTAVSGATVLAERRESHEASVLVADLELAVLAGDLLHETQRERGLTGLFLNSKGKSSSSELQTQRAETDEAVGEFVEYFEVHGSAMTPEAIEDVDATQKKLEGLAAQRSSISSFSLETAKALGWYTELNSLLIESAATFAADSPSADLQRKATALVTLMRAKENVGLERARLAVVFGSDKFTGTQFFDVSSAIAAQRSFLAVFESTAEPQLVDEYHEAMKNPDFVKVADMENIALSRATTGGFGVDPAVWFTAISHKIDLLAEIEDHHGEILIDGAREFQADANRALLLHVILTVLAVLASSALGWWVAAGVVAQVSRSARDLRTSSDRLTEVGFSLGASAEETATQANVVTQAGEHVSSSVSTVSAAVEEMSSSINEIAHSTSSAATAAAEAVTTVQATNATITQLGESSMEIGKVLDVITSIAEQTNLLALNATIEAARAGEAGKGFAVVANEVKDLAKETAEATTEIGNRIRAIQADSTGAAEAVNQIGAVVDRINGIQTTIASAIEEQTAAVGEIARSIAEAAAGTSEIATNISTVAVAASETSTGAQAAKVAGDDLSQLAAELQRIVEGGRNKSSATTTPFEARLASASNTARNTHRSRFGDDRNENEREFTH